MKIAAICVPENGLVQRMSRHNRALRQAASSHPCHVGSAERSVQVDLSASCCSIRCRDRTGTSTIHFNAIEPAGDLNSW
jgi:hypothetical protein